MPQSHTHQDPEQLAGLTAAEGVTHNAHGQSLADAREAFRAEWQAQIERKREQAERAKRIADRAEITIAVATLVGAAGGFVFGVVYSQPLFPPVGVWVGIVVTAPISLSAQWLASSYQHRAERQEQEARELERS